ncbi:MBL fold metallo-hydrolase [Halosimplex aquaticum]|uniref:MBL fold metallo-hydrolase n=1 Tax=Halosimplex aquaticum TaxID=3026162 RepID=A0ABD5Y0Z1_9EURY|nr:MBL fold metallo-hydrolase [Halosimplex aquaticum]
MATQLREGVWWIDLRGVNAYLVDEGGDLTLVDAGMPWQGGGVVDAIVEAGYVLDDLEHVLLTHYDVDHAGGLSRLDGLDVTIYAGQRDASLVTGREAPPFSIPKGALQRLLGPLYTPPSNEVVPLADGDEIGSFTVYETPGHTPGHLAYVSEDLGVAFLGDLVGESDGRLEPMPWIVTDDGGQVRESVRRLAADAPDFDVAAVGHGVPFERAGRARFDELAARFGHDREPERVRQ